MAIDIEALRDYLIKYYGSARSFFPVAEADLISIETASEQELLEKALELGIISREDLEDYDTNKRRTF